jgi:hypothetical protein
MPSQKKLRRSHCRSWVASMSVLQLQAESLPGRPVEHPAEHLCAKVTLPGEANMVRFHVLGVAGLTVAIAVVLGILGWTSIVKATGWGNAPTREASARPQRYSDMERSGRVYPNFR